MGKKIHNKEKGDSSSNNNDAAVAFSSSTQMTTGDADLLKQLITGNKKTLGRLEKISKTQKQFVTKEDLKELEDMLIGKMERAIEAIEKKLLKAIKEASLSQDDFFGHNELASSILEDVKAQMADLARSL